MQGWELRKLFRESRLCRAGIAGIALALALMALMRSAEGDAALQSEWFGHFKTLFAFSIILLGGRIAWALWHVERDREHDEHG